MSLELIRYRFGNTYCWFGLIMDRLIDHCAKQLDWKVLVVQYSALPLC